MILRLIIVLCLVIGLIANRMRYNADCTRRMKATGAGYSLISKAKLPFGADRIYLLFQAALNHRLLEFYVEAFRNNASPNRPTTFEARPGFRQRAIITIDPENFKAILATQFNDYGKGKLFHDVFRPLLGDGIFGTDGELWHTSRTLLRPQFLKDRVSDLALFEKGFQSLLPLLGSGNTVDVCDLFFRYTLDVATEFLFGKNVRSLENPDDKFAAEFGIVQHIQSLIARATPFAFLVNKKKYYAGIAKIDEYLDPFINEAIRMPQDDLEKLGKSDTQFTFLHALAQHTRDRKFIRDQILNILLAGRDTTANTLAWLFYHLSVNPQVVAKIRKEIEENVGTDIPTYETLKDLKYLRNCINEILRLYPIVPLNTKVALKDTTLPTGGGINGDEPIGVLKDEIVVYIPFVMQRTPSLHPPPSKDFAPIGVFSPERWDHWTPKPWTYIPFNGGPRICLGQQFALNEMAYTVVRIFQHFSAVETRQDGAPAHQIEILLAPHGGVKVAFKQ